MFGAVHIPPPPHKCFQDRGQVFCRCRYSVHHHIGCIVYKLMTYTPLWGYYASLHQSIHATALDESWLMHVISITLGCLQTGLKIMQTDLAQAATASTSASPDAHVIVGTASPTGMCIRLATLKECVRMR
jgi:hypothetical protein